MRLQGQAGAGPGRALKIMLGILSLSKGRGETLEGVKQLEEEAMIRFAFRQSPLQLHSQGESGVTSSLLAEI